MGSNQRMSNMQGMVQQDMPGGMLPHNYGSSGIQQQQVIKTEMIDPYNYKGIPNPVTRTGNQSADQL